MAFPYFFEMRKGADKVRVDSSHNNVFEFNIQFANGVTDQFLYDMDASFEEKGKLVQGNLSRVEAIKYFDEYMKVY